MPSLIINTNVPKNVIPEEFITELSSLVANMVGKPETYVAIHINPDQMMTFGGSSGPCAICAFNCIGKLGVEENKQYTATLMEKITKVLKIPADRMYINFTDLPRGDCGWNGKTFAQ